MPHSAGQLDSSLTGVVAVSAFAGVTLWYLLASIVLVVWWVRSPARSLELEPAT
jgi:hypothetical protein